jgi:DNA sulfur modification protein DndD
MELVRLTLENFRQFYGVQEIEFADGAEKNITVIHGPNGSGKTTLLNAFTWLFYDTVTLPHPDEVASDRALAEAELEEEVPIRGELVFEHKGTRYTFSREQTVERASGDDLVGTQVDEELMLEYVDDFGNTKQRSNPSVAIKQIMPKRLREVFFFDGETIDKMVANDQESVQKAIRNIMGLEILERADTHLDYVRREFQSEMEEHGSDEIQALIARQDEIEDQIEQNKEELSDVGASRGRAEEELEEVREKLESRRESRRLEKKRQGLESDLEEKKAAVEETNGEIGGLIAEEGQLPFALPAVERTAEMLNEKRKSGEIPSEIKETLVDDLLEGDECICGRPLPDGSEPRQSVAAYRERAGSSELEEMAMQIAGRLSDLANSQESFYTNLDTSLEERSGLKDDKRTLEEELDEVSDKLKNTDEDIEQLETRREQLEDDIETYTEEIGQIKGNIDDLNDDLSDIEDDIAEAEEENEKSERARRRTQTARYLRDNVTGLYETFQDQVRQSVNERVNDLYQRILTKNYFIEVSEEYKLEFRQSIKGNPDQTVAVSTGERQVASLSFISSLVSLARERYESDEDSPYFTGGIYPVVMDSPFGALDPEYQREVSKVVPEMAEQVVVMLTDSQWSDEVSNEMGPLAACEYDLVYHDSDEDGTEYEYTEIRQSTEEV